jgi:hypothetical protein
VDELWESRQYEISLPCELKKVEQLQDRLQACGLKGHVIQKEKVEGHLVCTLAVSGATHKQNKFVDLVLVDPEISAIEW